MILGSLGAKFLLAHLFFIMMSLLVILIFLDSIKKKTTTERQEKKIKGKITEPIRTNACHWTTRSNQGY